MSPVVLIHGAWQGAWAWEAFLPWLTRAGHRAEAVDLPGNGTDDTPPEAVTLEGYVAHVASVLERLGSAHVIGHSGGGLVASAVAEAVPERVRSLTYVAGMMLPSGMAFADLVAEMLPRHPEAAGIGPHLVWSGDRLTSRVPRAAALACFFDDCPPAAAAEAAGRLTPQPEGGRAVRATLTPARFGTVPRLYVEAGADHSVAPALQRRMQALVPGAELAVLPTGHAPHLAAPRLLAEAVLPFLAGQDARALSLSTQGTPAT
ncbi:MAG: alkyl salicylate esterase [Rhodovulum sulfidophilum]|uniref:Alkyl salicylate esterase n=1 Tax=Rhodovulum sulfidophilum TaxID=35806 RepID=A0A2W5NBC9_RHOSU|nr:MAG: alkyl salicylate esterase [Rhodovulum sulfidophilum]